MRAMLAQEGAERLALSREKLIRRKLHLCQLYPCMRSRKVAFGLFPEARLDHGYGAAAAVVPPLTVAGEHSLNKGDMQEARLRSTRNQHEKGNKPWHSTWGLKHVFLKRRMATA